MLISENYPPQPAYSSESQGGFIHQLPQQPLQGGYPQQPPQGGYYEQQRGSYLELSQGAYPQPQAYPQGIPYDNLPAYSATGMCVFKCEWLS